MHSRLELAARRTRGWITALLESPVKMGLASQLDLPVLAELCTDESKGEDRGRKLFHEACAHLAAAIDQLPPVGAFKALLATDARRVLLAYGALRLSPARCVRLEEFVGGLATSLAQVESPGPEVAETLQLCRTFGLLASEPHAGSDTIPLPSVLELLHADEPAIQRTLDDVARICRYGNQDAALAADAREKLTAVVPVWMLDFARGYKLSQAATALRILAYIGDVEERIMGDGIRFVLDQQHPGGWFGFFGPELARMRAKGGALDPMSELHLPVTLACHWALREATSTFRLAAPRITALSDRATLSATV